MWHVQCLSQLSLEELYYCESVDSYCTLVFLLLRWSPGKGLFFLLFEIESRDTQRKSTIFRVDTHLKPVLIVPSGSLRPSIQLGPLCFTTNPLLFINLPINFCWTVHYCVCFSLNTLRLLYFSFCYGFCSRFLFVLSVIPISKFLSDKYFEITRSDLIPTGLCLLHNG